MGSYGNAYVAGRADTTPHRPSDMVLEMFEDAPGTFSLGDRTAANTDATTLIENVSFLCPVSQDSSPDAMAVALGINGTADFVGEAATHFVHVIGGFGLNTPRGFRLPTYDSNLRSGSNRLVFEIVQHNIAGAAVLPLTVTANTDLSVIKQILFGIPVNIRSAAPYAVGISSITNTTAVLTGSNSSAIITVLWAGFANPAAGAAETYSVGGDLPYLLEGMGGGCVRKPGDLIGEIITTAALDGASPATLTTDITAATDCEWIRHIEMVIPVTLSTTAGAVAWTGTQGKVTNIFASNSKTDTVSCLILGR